MSHPSNRGDRLAQKRRLDTVRAPQKEKLRRVIICTGIFTSEAINKHNSFLAPYKRPGHFKSEDRQATGKPPSETQNGSGTFYPDSIPAKKPRTVYCVHATAHSTYIMHPSRL